MFSLSSGELGRTAVTKHHINTGDAQPVHLLPRCIPQARRDEVKRLIQEMLDQGAIQQSDSPWSSPVVLTKKDGSTRFCIDYRKVNEVTRKDAYPLPRVDDTLDTLVGSKYFSMLDLASGYWQVEVAENDQPKTAFTTPEGLFQFRVMPFGLCNAPAMHFPAANGPSSERSEMVYLPCVLRRYYGSRDILCRPPVQYWWRSCKALGGGAEAETRKVPSLPETCCLSWTYCVSRGNHHRPEQNGGSCKMAQPTVPTRSAAISRTRELLQMIREEFCSHCWTTSASH